MGVRLSPNFTLEELTESSTARRFPRIFKQQQHPPDEIATNLQRLANDTLEPLRALLGGWPIHVNSGYRCRDLNARIGGSKTSQHMSGLAADIVPLPPRMSPRRPYLNSVDRPILRALAGQPVSDTFMLWEACVLLAEELKVDQVIHEYGNGWGDPSWVHVSTALAGDEPRHHALVIGDWTGRRYQGFDLDRGLDELRAFAARSV